MTALFLPTIRNQLALSFATRRCLSAAPRLSASLPLPCPPSFSFLCRAAGEDNQPAASGPEIQADELLNSKLPSSQAIQEEMQSIMSKFLSVSALFSKFFEWDVYGQRYYISELEGLVERIDTFLFRATLTDDAQKMLSTMNVQVRSDPNLNRSVENTF